MSNPIGHVNKQQHWYELSDGTTVSFHTAYTNKERTSRVMFVSDEDTWPSVTAERLGIDYFFMRNSTPNEISEFMSEMGITTKDADSGS